MATTTSMDGDAVKLARERNELLAQLLALTEQEDFTALDVSDTKKAERFTMLYNRRAGMMERLQAVSKALGAPGGAAAGILAEGNPMLERLIALDKRYAIAAGEVLEALKRHLHDLNAGRTASVAYQTEIVSEGGALYDKAY